MLIAVLFCTSCRFRFLLPNQLPIRKQKPELSFQTKVRIGNRLQIREKCCRMLVADFAPVADSDSSCRFRKFLHFSCVFFLSQYISLNLRHKWMPDIHCVKQTKLSKTMGSPLVFPCFFHPFPPAEEGNMQSLG